MGGAFVSLMPNARRLARKAQALGRQVLNELATLVARRALQGCAAVAKRVSTRGASRLRLRRSHRCEATARRGDSNLYLRRLGHELNLTVEHRAAPSPPSIALELAQPGDALALEVIPATATELVDDASSAPSATPTAHCLSRNYARSAAYAKATLYARLTELVSTAGSCAPPTAITSPHRLIIPRHARHVAVPGAGSHSPLQHSGTGTGNLPQIARPLAPQKRDTLSAFACPNVCSAKNTLNHVMRLPSLG